MDQPYPLPSDLPVPEDDGAARHLPGQRLPDLALPATRGPAVNLRHLAGRVVIFCYPRTGVPGEAMPEGWDDIPGARGCTPQACSFRDLASDFTARNVKLFGLSTQTTAYQREMAERLHLPYPVLSDHEMRLSQALNLPTFKSEGVVLLKRMSWIIDNATITRVFYPVFPPDRDAETVLTALDTLGPAA